MGRRSDHGHSPAGSPSPTYRTWGGMVQRCTNPKTPEWKYYGGRGVTVCERWLKFENFLADMGERPEGLTLDRRKNDGGYSKDNCRWSTHSEQMQNTRQNVVIEIGGRSQCLAAWCREYKMDQQTVTNRVQRRGVTWEQALKEPVIKF